MCKCVCIQEGDMMMVWLSMGGKKAIVSNGNMLVIVG